MIQDTSFSLKSLLIFISAASIALFSSSSLAAITIRVPADQPTIQAGIDAAVNGDTVLVADGTYTGEGNRDIDFKGKAITVKSENGPENCIVDCEDYNVRGFYFGNGETQTSILDGFCITRTNISGSSSIYCKSSPKITNCHIISNNNDGIGIYSSATIDNCKVNENSGDGIYVYLYLNNNDIITIENVEINNNYDTGIRIGYLNETCNITISNCYISFNNKYGIYSSNADADINHCTIHDNGDYVPGIWLYYSSPHIDSCIISQNDGGIYCSSYSSPTIENCLIKNNISIGDGPAIYSNKSTSSPTIINCTITENTGTYSDYGGVYLNYGGPLIKNVISWGNTPNNNFVYGDKVSYSDMAGYSGTGVGNIDTDPLFLGIDNYHLSTGSPCIDTGTSSGAPDIDIEGTARPQGSGYDMGAYEYFVPPCPNCSGADPIITNTSFPCRECECVGTASITIGPGVTIPEGAKVTFKAPIINVKAGFHAETGAVVNMRQE